MKITMDLKLAIILLVSNLITTRIHNNMNKTVVKSMFRYLWFLELIGFCIFICRYIFLLKI